jgi:hypothetical protein
MSLQQQSFVVVVVVVVAAAVLAGTPLDMVPNNPMPNTARDDSQFRILHVTTLLSNNFPSVLGINVGVPIPTIRSLRIKIVKTINATGGKMLL